MVNQSAELETNSEARETDPESGSLHLRILSFVGRMSGRTAELEMYQRLHDSKRRKGFKMISEAEKIAAVELLQELIDHELNQEDYRNIDTAFVDECVSLILSYQDKQKSPSEAF